MPPERSITKEDVIDEESEGLAPQDVELALKNVSNLFGGGEPHTPFHSDSIRGPAPGNRASRGRTRVDSSARPPEFAHRPDKNKKADVDYRNFSVHGISEPLLRQRLESKVVSQDTVDRVKSDFAPHDHLSSEELASLEEMVKAAHKLHVNKDDKGAEAIYQQVLDADPVHYECLTNLAKIAYGRGDFGRAKELFERAIVVKPHFDKTVYHLAVVLFDMRDFERSQNLFNEVVQGFTGETDGRAEKCDTHTYHNAVAMLGLIHQQVHGDHEKAGILYHTVLTKNPDHVLTLDHKASLLVWRNEREEAAKVHKRVCTLDPNHTKKVCPYLDSLFPQQSELFHPVVSLPERLEQNSDAFDHGAQKKSWANHPWRSLCKKMSRLCKSGGPPPSNHDSSSPTVSQRNMAN
eukprot:CAMPEP_0196723128 /NCGR_PEP_ID=MMETSP1091-20130531/5291_1 /TAXON_ID=302021 /ORGANISM="Rhodomonas sp., Strain CCMP768" /LENGTH=405 /DNA_ID=CAMNT_0042064959 /DNA_START=84 /DNA_END=1301 /DNA_ORIENTATION=-